MKKIITAFALLAFFGTVISPNCGHNLYCPENNTCCLNLHPENPLFMVCCPTKNAICCTDNLHCCPSGYFCDYVRNRCTKGNNSFLAYVSLNDDSAPFEKTSSSNYTPNNPDYKFLMDIEECGKLDQKLGYLALKAYQFFKSGTKEGRLLSKITLGEILKQKITKGTICHAVTEKLILLLN